MFCFVFKMMEDWLLSTVGYICLTHNPDHSLKVQSPRMALTGDLPGGQETHTTGVRLACRGGLQGWPAGPMRTLRCECEEWMSRGGKVREELLWSLQLGTAGSMSQAPDPGPLSTVRPNWEE